MSGKLSSRIHTECVRYFLGFSIGDSHFGKHSKSGLLDDKDVPKRLQFQKCFIKIPSDGAPDMQGTKATA